jgi:hypothetical protein
MKGNFVGSASTNFAHEISVGGIRQINAIFFTAASHKFGIMRKANTSNELGPSRNDVSAHHGCNVPESDDRVASTSDEPLSIRRKNMGINGARVSWIYDMLLRRLFLLPIPHSKLTHTLA